MPDADQLMIFLLQVLEIPVRYVATFIGAIGILLFFYMRVKELVNKWTS
jgi:hypothetical protein